MREIETSLEAFDISSNNLQLEYNKCIDNSVKATIQKLYDVGLFDRFENKQESFRDYINFDKRQRGKDKWMKNNDVIFHRLLLNSKIRQHQKKEVLNKLGKYTNIYRWQNHNKTWNCKL